MKKYAFISLIIVLIISPFVGDGIYILTKYSGTDCLLSIFLTIILGILYLYILYNISNYEKDLYYIEKIKKLFNKKTSKIILFLLLISIIITTTNKMYGIIDYTASQFLFNTPPLYLGIIYTLLIIYINFKDINIIKKLSLIIVIINIIFLVLVLIGLLPQFNVMNLKPLFVSSYNNILKSSLLILSINVIPIFVVLNMEKNIKNSNITIGYLFGFLVIFIIMFSVLSIMGIYLLNYYQYPAYIVLQYVNIFDFISKIENILNIQWILGLFVSIAIFINYICSNFKNKIFKIIIPILIMLLSFILFKNNIQFNKYVINIYPIFSAIILICNVLIFIKIKIDKLSISTSKTNK